MIPQFSLCIPTYNRAGLLEQALRVIAAQWQQDLDGAERAAVEVVVSDNHSTDDTPQVVEQVRADTGLPIRYSCQAENRGADANILSAMQAARGEFVYLLSDDDLLLPGALRKLFALLRDYPSADGFCPNMRQFLLDPAEPTVPGRRLPADLTITGRDAALLFLGTEITFISALVFRRSRAGEMKYEDRVGTSLLQSYVYLDVLAGDPVIVATALPYLAVRGNNSGGFNFFEAFVTQFRALMDHAQTLGFAPRTVQKVLDRHLRVYLMSYAVVMRVRESYGTFQPDFADAARRLRAAYGGHPFLHLALLPALAAPLGLLRGAHAGLKWAKAQVNRGRRA